MKLNVNNKILKERIDNLLNLVGLKDKKNIPVETFSKGMKQRLQIARGLINDPQYLFLDEPTIGLDAVVSKEMRKHIKSLAKEQNKGILLTSHYMGEIEELCDYIYILNDGSLIKQGTVKELASETFNRKNYVLKLYSNNKDTVRCIEDRIKSVDSTVIYEKNYIIDIMQKYYEEVFLHEIDFLKPFLIHTIKREIKAYREEGVLDRIAKIHERIEIKGNEIILHKNKEYHFDAKKLSKISITASTFISPHLLMHEDKGILYLTMLVLTEEKKETVPADLVNLLKALGDETRLKILHEMRKDTVTTQALSVSLKLTEAGISKHLKVLSNAGLVNKVRHGNYMLYSINKDAIDYIPYKLYEYIMR